MSTAHRSAFLWAQEHQAAVLPLLVSSPKAAQGLTAAVLVIAFSQRRVVTLLRSASLGSGVGGDISVHPIQTAKGPCKSHPPRTMSWPHYCQCWSHIPDVAIALDTSLQACLLFCNPRAALDTSNIPQNDTGLCINSMFPGRLPRSSEPAALAVRSPGAKTRARRPWCRCQVFGRF